MTIEVNYKGLATADIADHLRKINEALADWESFCKRREMDAGDRAYCGRLKKTQKYISKAIKEFGYDD